MPNPSRDEIACCKAELEAARKGPLPLPQIEAGLTRLLQKLEQPYLSALSRASRHLATTQQAHPAALVEAIGVNAQKVDFTLGMLVHFHRDALLAKLMAQVETHPTPPRLPEAERLEKADKQARALYQLELKEEHRVEAGLADRRPDADPRAVLGLPESVAFDPRLQKLMEYL